MAGTTAKRSPMRTMVCCSLLYSARRSAALTTLSSAPIATRALTPLFRSTNSLSRASMAMRSTSTRIRSGTSTVARCSSDERISCAVIFMPSSMLSG